MKIENVVTFTVLSPTHNAYTEQTVWLQRSYALTYPGAQRIIRRDHPKATVIHIQTLVRA